MVPEKQGFPRQPPAQPVAKPLPPHSPPPRQKAAWQKGDAWPDPAAILPCLPRKPEGKTRHRHPSFLSLHIRSFFLSPFHGLRSLWRLPAGIKKGLLPFGKDIRHHCGSCFGMFQDLFQEPTSLSSCHRRTPAFFLPRPSPVSVLLLVFG